MTKVSGALEAAPRQSTCRRTKHIAAYPSARDRLEQIKPILQLPVRLFIRDAGTHHRDSMYDMVTFLRGPHNQTPLLCPGRTLQPWLTHVCFEYVQHIRARTTHPRSNLKSQPPPSPPTPGKLSCGHRSCENFEVNGYIKYVSVTGPKLQSWTVYGKTNPSPCWPEVL